MTATLARSILVEPRAVDQARQAQRWIEHRDVLAVVSETGSPNKLPHELATLLGQVISTLSAGGTVTVRVIPEQLSTTEAAAQLGVSRTTLMKLIAAGEIASHKVGSHHRLLAKDVHALRERRRAHRLVALAQLRELDDEAGLDT